MAITTAEKFLDVVAENEDLQKKFRSAKSEAQVMEILKSENIECSPDEIRAAFLERFGSELNEEQLAAFSGGASAAAIGAAVGIGAGVTVGLAVALGASAAAAA